MKTIIKSIAISEQQNEALILLSKQSGQSVSNLVRQGINIIVGVYKDDGQIKTSSLDKVAN